MHLPLPFPLSVVAFFAIVIGMRLIATRLPATVATKAVGGTALVLVYVGPHLYGTDWYYMGYGLGVFIGSFGWMAYVRMTETEKKEARWRQNQTSLVILMLLLIGLLVMLATSH